MEKLLLTPHEAAEVLGIGRSKLYQLMRAGTVTSVRIGSCRRIPAAALPDLIDRLQADAHHDAPRWMTRHVHSEFTCPQNSPPQRVSTATGGTPST